MFTLVQRALNPFRRQVVVPMTVVECSLTSVSTSYQHVAGIGYRLHNSVILSVAVSP